MKHMKRPTCRGSSMASQETTDQQEEISRYMDRQEVDGHGTGEQEDAAVGAYDDGEEEEDVNDEEDLAGGAGRGACGLGEKKRRLAAEQVRALERSFEADNKLDPERKARIARDLRLHPRQVAVWFQNRRARWKTKQIERDFASLRSRHDALRLECDALRRDKDSLAAEIRELREKVEKQMAVKLEEAAEERPSAATVAPAAAVYKDGSTDSDSSAVFNEEASPYSSAAAFYHLRHQPSFTGFTSFLAPSSALSSSFPSLYHGSHLDQDDGFLGAASAAAADEFGGASFFAEEHGGGLSWYGSQGW